MFFGISGDIALLLISSVIFFLILYFQGKTLYTRIILGIIIGLALYKIAPIELFNLGESILGRTGFSNLILFGLMSILGFFALRKIDFMDELETPNLVRNVAAAVIAGTFSYVVFYSVLGQGGLIPGNSLAILINNPSVAFALFALPIVYIARVA